ncbi:MAG: pyruvate carboxylase subunit B [Clostridia bacterium]|nr:pyruvate carboxylase subunit B [Clostridia bacterium]
MPRLKITETVLCGAQSALASAHMTTAEMVPILPILDKIGYHSLDAWGGSSFDTCLRYLNEDPWKRLRIIRANIHNTKLMMTLGGQCLLGYSHYPDDIVQFFVQKSIANGIDILRIYDPLNDIRNLEVAIRAAKKEKASVQGSICCTSENAENGKYFLEFAKRLLDLGADTICIQDTAGLLRPYDAYQIIKTLKAYDSSMQIQLSTHYTSGLASMTVLKAVEAGLDIVDTAISPFSLGASLLSTETILATLRKTPYETELDTYFLRQAAEYFSGIKLRYLRDGIMDNRIFDVNITALESGVSGEMQRHIAQRLKQAKKERYFAEVLEEIPRVAADVGHVPFVSPLYEILDTQAILNVLTGERYKIVSEEFRNLVLGKYGRTPNPINREFQHKISKGAPIITERPADSLEPEVEKYRIKAAPYAEQEEDLLSLALFENSAMQFFEWRKKQKYNLDGRGKASNKSAVHPV